MPRSKDNGILGWGFGAYLWGWSVGFMFGIEGLGSGCNYGSRCILGLRFRVGSCADSTCPVLFTLNPTS